MRPGFMLVVASELSRLRHRPFLIVLTCILPVALMLLLTLVFSAGLATNLPIAVLDLDRSEMSRVLIRTVDATPDAEVAYRANDLAEGKSLILSGAARGLLLIPLNFERDVLSGRRPEVVFFYNTQTLTIGNLVLRGINSAVPAVAANIRLSLRTAEGESVDSAQQNLTPIPVQSNALFNPTLNYVFFLLNALVPSVLQVVIVTSFAYAVGFDLETGTRFVELRREGGGLWPAMFGKLIAYVIIYLSVLFVFDAVLFGIFELPMRGSPWVLLANGVLFILACELIGACLALWVKPVGGAVGVATLLTAPAFGFMGVGFPRLGMNAFAFGWGECLPGTWYLVARVDQTVRGTPLDLSWHPILVLLAIVICLSVVVGWRVEYLRVSAITQRSL